MLNDETRRKVRELGWEELIEGVQAQAKLPECLTLSFEERLSMLIDHIYQEKLNHRTKRLISQAKFRFKDADVNSIYYEERGLNKNVLLELATCQFLATATNLVFQGFTGSGKTFLACAIGKAACRHKFRVRYIRIPDMFELLAAAMISSGGYARILRRFARYHLLILDEWLANPFSDDEIRFLFELIERRYGAGSTIFCTQHPIAEWHACLGGDAIADSIMDRIVQNAIQIDTGAKNMRKHLSSHSMLDDKNLSD